MLIPNYCFYYIFKDILLYKDDGFSKVQNCIEIGQIVLANTAPEGHKSINEALISLQEHWSSLASKMVETKVDSLFQINKTIV